MPSMMSPCMQMAQMPNMHCYGAQSAVCTYLDGSAYRKHIVTRVDGSWNQVLKYGSTGNCMAVTHFFAMVRKGYWRYAQPCAQQPLQCAPVVTEEILRRMLADVQDQVRLSPEALLRWTSGILEFVQSH